MRNYICQQKKYKIYIFLSKSRIFDGSFFPWYTVPTWRQEVFHEEETQKRKVHGPFFLNLLKVIFSIFLILMILGLGAGGIVYLKFGMRFRPVKNGRIRLWHNRREKIFRQSSDTRIYDSPGQVIGIINTGHYEYVPITGDQRESAECVYCPEDKRFRSITVWI